MPKRTAPRPLPFHQQDKFKVELNKMLNLGFLIEVDKATPFINALFCRIQKQEQAKSMPGSKEP